MVEVWLMRVAAFILLSTASLKLVSILVAHGDTVTILNVPSLLCPLVTERFVMIVAIIFEYAIVLFLLLNRSYFLRFAAIGWFTAVCLSYRFLLSTFSGSSCGCAGKWPQGYQETSDAVATGMLILLLAIGGFGLIKHGFLQLSKSRLYCQMINRSANF